MLFKTIIVYKTSTKIINVNVTTIKKKFNYN